MVSKEDVGFELLMLEQACRLAQAEAASTTNDIESQLALMNITRTELATTSREDSDDDSSSDSASSDDDDDATSSDCSDESSSTSSSSSDDEVDDSSAKAHNDETLISSSSPAAAVTARQSLLTTGAGDVDNQTDKEMFGQKTQHEPVLADSKTDQSWTDSKSEAKSCSPNSSSCPTTEATEAKGCRTDTKSLNF